MKRYTKQTSKGEWFVEHMDYAGLKKAHAKLAAYEDTGLEPSEVEGLKRRIKVLERALELAAKSLEIKINVHDNYSAYHYYVSAIKQAEKELEEQK